MSPRRPARAPSSHVEEVHRAEAAVDAIEERQRRVRGAARAAFGVVDDGSSPPPWPEEQLGALVAPVLALGAILAVDQLQTWAFTIVAPEIGRTLGVRRGELASLLVLKLLVIVVAALPMAAATNSRPRRAWLVRAGAAVWTVGAVGAALTVSKWGLAGAMAAAGIGAAAIDVAHRPLVMELTPPGGRVRAFSVYRSAAVAGAVLAPALVGALHAAGLTWRAVLGVVALAGAAAAAGARWVRDPGFGARDARAVRALVSDEMGADQATGGLSFFESVRRAIAVPTVRVSLGGWAALGYMTLSLPVFLGFFLEERWGMGAAARSWFVALAWLPALAALAWFGPSGERLMRRDPRRLATTVGGLYLAFVGAGFLAAFAPVLVLMYAGWALMFAAAALIAVALTMVMLTAVAPRLRAHAAALAGVVFAGVGGVAGVLVLNGIDRRFGLGWAVAVSALGGLVGALVARAVVATVDADLDRVIDDVVEAEEIRQLERSGRHLPMLSCRHVDFSYAQLQVLFDVNFTVDDGEMVALLGTNGAGKSTLLRVISGLGIPSRGSVHFRGTDVTYVDAERRLSLGITQIPGGNAVFAPLSVVENLRMFGYSLGTDRAAVERGIDATLEAFPRLAERRNQLAATLSGGEQQMLALGKAFMLSPRLLLIDELSLGLAPKVVGELLEMVRRINAAGTAVVLVEQSVNIALALVDHAYFMEKGEIRFDGAARDLLGRRDLLRSVFLEGATRGAVTRSPAKKPPAKKAPAKKAPAKKRPPATKTAAKKKAPGAKKVSGRLQ